MAKNRIKNTNCEKLDKNSPKSLLQMSLIFVALIIGGSLFTGIAKCLNIDWILLIGTIFVVGYLKWVNPRNKEFDFNFRIWIVILSVAQYYISIYFDLIGIPMSNITIVIILHFFIIYANSLHKLRYDKNYHLELKNIFASFAILLINCLIICTIVQPIIDTLYSDIWNDYRNFNKASEDFIGCVLINSCYICVFVIPLRIARSALQFVLSNKAFTQNKSRNKVFNWIGFEEEFVKGLVLGSIGPELNNFQNIVYCIYKIIFKKNRNLKR